MNRAINTLLIVLGCLVLATTPLWACWVDEKGTCRTCNGTGQQSCQYCNSGYQKCTQCMGQGKVVVKCRSCNGTGMASKDTACGACDGSGQRTETCEGCNGDGKNVCGSCNGSGQRTCFGCNGSGETVVGRKWDENCGKEHPKSE